MGGRGGSGGGIGGSYGFSAPNVSGSDKQRSYAKDIMENPHKNLGYRASLSERLGDKKDAEIFRSAQRKYADAVGQVKNRAGDRFDAKWVIDQKGAFQSMAQQILQDEAKKRGKRPYDYRI